MKRNRNVKHRSATVWGSLLPVTIIVILLLVPHISLGMSATDVLKQYESLTGEKRETKLIEGAKREQKMVFYGTTISNELAVILDEFKKKYPFISTEFYRSGAINVYNRTTTEAAAGRHTVDVISLLSGETYEMTKKGLVDPYLSPHRAGIMPEFMDQKGFWTAIYHIVIVSGYNTKNVKREEVPKTYESLLDPKWKGRLGLDNEDMDLMGTLTDYWGKEKGLTYFKKLAQNKPSMRRGHTLLAQILAAGEIDVSPWLFGFSTLNIKRKGGPVEVVLLNPVLTIPTYLLVAKNAPHPHSAALFIDWMLSEQGGMKLFAERFGKTASRPGYRDIFMELVAPQYLVVTPEKIGPNYQEYKNRYCEIFGHC